MLTATGMPDIELEGTGVTAIRPERQPDVVKGVARIVGHELVEPSADQIPTAQPEQSAGPEARLDADAVLVDHQQRERRVAHVRAGRGSCWQV